MKIYSFFPTLNSNITYPISKANPDKSEIPWLWDLSTWNWRSARATSKIENFCLCLWRGSVAPWPFLIGQSSIVIGYNVTCKGATIGGKTGKTAVLPGFCKIERGGGCYRGLICHGPVHQAGGAPDMLPLYHVRDVNIWSRPKASLIWWGILNTW